MPPKKITTSALSRPQRNPPSSANLPSTSSSHSTEKRRRSGRTEATTEPTTSKSDNVTVSKKTTDRVPSRVQTRNDPNISNSKSAPTPELIKPSTIPVRKRLGYTRGDRQLAYGETIDKKTKAVASSSKQVDAELDRNAHSRLTGSNKQRSENEDVPAEVSGHATLRSRKSALMEIRKLGSTTVENASFAENSRRQNKRLSLDVRKVSREHDSEAPVSNVSTGSSIEDLAGRAWCLYHVSPLYGLNRKPSVLKQYGRFLRTSLTATRAALPDAADVRYSAAFTTLPELRWKESQPEGLQVEVLSLVEGHKPKALYTGILLSWGDDAPAPTPNASALPLLLCAGVVRTTWNVHLVLSRLFDAVIQPMQANHTDFKWVGAISLHRELPPPDVPLQLYFAEGARTVTCLTVPATRVHKFWCRIHDNKSDMLLVDEVEELHEAMQEMVAPMNCIESDALALVRIEFPSVTLWKDGRLKVKNAGSVDLTLRYFCSKAVEIANPLRGLHATATSIL